MVRILIEELPVIIAWYISGILSNSASADFDAAVFVISASNASLAAIASLIKVTIC